jgi:type VI secretion system protein ImpA
MSDELQKPPVVDLDLLLQPISEENPSGESLRYSGLYDEITEARRADDNLNQGEWQTEVKLADYRRVIDLAVPALATQAKDLQIAAWLSESLVKQYGFAGLRDGLKLAAGFQEKFWETLHPEIDEGDMEGRANAVSWIDTQVGLAIKSVPFTGGEGYSFFDWEDSRRFDIPENVETLPSEDQKKYNDLKAQAEKQNRVTGELWKKEKAATRRAQTEEVNYLLDECWAAFNDLNKVVEEKFDRNQMPGLGGLKKALDDIHTQVKKILEEKRIEEPDPVEEEEAEGEGGEATNGASGGAGKASGSGAIVTRKDALRRLAEIADYFQRTEPHSPVSYLVQRAVKWGNMPLENWLQDVIKDESILSQLRQTLGFNTGGNEPNGES